MGTLSISSWYFIRAAEMKLTQIPPFNIWPYSLNRIMSSFKPTIVIKKKTLDNQLRTDRLDWAFILYFILLMPSLNLRTISKEQHILLLLHLFSQSVAQMAQSQLFLTLPWTNSLFCSCLDSFSLSHPINFGYKIREREMLSFPFLFALTM